MQKIINRIEKIISRPVTKTRLFSLKTLLQLLSKLYKFVINARISLYQANILKSRKLPCFVISLGNITAGGTGKTPMTIHIADLVRRLGYRVAVVSRGYRGNFEHSMGIVCDGEKLCCTPEESGDEPYMIAKNLGVPVLAGKDRYKVGIKAMEEFNPDVIVLDDAFQHIKLQRDLDILLLDAGQPFGNGELLPRGRLREPISSIKRCSALILTRSNQALNSNSLFLNSTSPLYLEYKKPTVPLFRCSHVPFIRHMVWDKVKNEDQNSGSDNDNYNNRGLAKDHDWDNRLHNQWESDNWGRLHGKSCFLFSGLANNENFRNNCEKQGIKITGFIDFPDHFWYSKMDIEMICTRFKESRADFIVTTEKDYVKITPRFSMSPLVVIDVKIVFEKKSQIPFESFIAKRLKSHIDKNRHGRNKK